MARTAVVGSLIAFDSALTTTSAMSARSGRARWGRAAAANAGSPYLSAGTALLGPGPFFDCGPAAAEPHILSPRIAAGTKIPHTRGHRARKGGTNLYRGILQPGRYAVRPPRTGRAVGAEMA